MSLAQRFIAGLVILVVVVAVAFLALYAVGVPVGRGPDPDPTPSPASSDPASPDPSRPAPSATSEPDPVAVFDQIEVEVETLRELPPADIDPEVIDRPQLGAELEALFAENYPEAERRADNIALRAMGLLAEEEDVAELRLRLLGSQVVGFYNWRDQRLVVVSDRGVDAEVKFTYAHEYAHALQDAAFSLASLETDVAGEDDRGLARTALMEGDATLTMTLWAVGGGLTEEDLLAIGQLGIPDTSGIPDWMLATLEFPYSAGFLWAQQLYAEGGFAAIDEAFANPPTSTEQIIHFEKWEAREEPILVEVPDIVTGLGDGWEQVESTPNGEAFISITLQQLGIERSAADAAAAGWGGDRMVVAAGPGGAFALAWILAWDAPADAQEFAATYRDALGALPFPAELVELPSGELLVVHASSQEILAATRAAAGG